MWQTTRPFGTVSGMPDTVFAQRLARAAGVLLAGTMELSVLEVDGV